MKFFAATVAALAASFSLAQAAVISVTLPEVSVFGEAPYPNTAVPAGTFTYNLNGQTIVSASLAGTWGNSQAITSAWADAFADGILFAQCIQEDLCWQAAAGAPTAFTYDFTDFGELLDGELLITLVQNSGFITRFGALTLNIVTADAVPLPAAFPLMLAGVGGIAALRRRKKAA